jgi:hypothetical protein
VELWPGQIADVTSDVEIGGPIADETHRVKPKIASWIPKAIERAA